MEILYIKQQTEHAGNSQSISVQYLVNHLLPEIKSKSLAWVGIEENPFLSGEPSVFALVTFEGQWDPKEITDKLIQDIVDPPSDIIYPSPFTDFYKKLEFSRNKFKTHLKGGIIYE
jgi:hypothetical protein